MAPWVSGRPTTARREGGGCLRAREAGVLHPLHGQYPRAASSSDAVHPPILPPALAVVRSGGGPTQPHCDPPGARVKDGGAPRDCVEALCFPHLSLLSYSASECPQVGVDALEGGRGGGGEARGRARSLKEGLPGSVGLKHRHLGGRVSTKGWSRGRPPARAAQPWWQKADERDRGWNLGGGGVAGHRQ